MATNNKTQMILSHDNSIAESTTASAACDVSSAAFLEVHSSDYRWITSATEDM